LQFLPKRRKNVKINSAKLNLSWISRTRHFLRARESRRKFPSSAPYKISFELFLSQYYSTKPSLSTQ
jgi:hypothetical protein